MYDPVVQRLRLIADFTNSGPCMVDIEQAIAALQVEMDQANAAIAEAMRKRRETNKDSPLVMELNAAVTAARQALAAIEIKLRQLYESKSDD